ncbi:MAG: GntR family transcriptional regulator [Acetobacteraceae bacterium]|nr:GntR family transcriptional regulator [Acetobacteraceae bacterium]
MGAAPQSVKARRIYLMLRERIAAGDIAAGQRLPSEPVLAAEQGVSRVTIRRALDRLAEEGLVSRRVGAGTFVTDGMLSPVIAANLANVFTQLKTMGQTTGLRLLAFAYGPAPDAVAQALGLPPGARTQRSVRVRLVDGEPFSYLTTHVPERIGQTYTEADLASRPLLELLERSGIVADRASQTLSATLAGPDVADALQLEVGAPLLSLTRVVHDPAGAGVEHLHALYRPDRFAFHLDLTRSGDLRRWDLNPKPRRKRSP